MLSIQITVGHVADCLALKTCIASFYGRRAMHSGYTLLCFCFVIIVAKVMYPIEKRPLLVQVRYQPVQ
jgi:hypothetical protein